ncbi:MAG: GNAT family N-acetyltransferase [Planctomycetaceae bacterium]|jgi:RimJ/RimL family protein N-acetyltransferase|nr:GNAT family N-acetyltransferase [Planctomycetaceae bacterium]
MKHLFYINKTMKAESISIDTQYTYQFWHPSFTTVLPKGLKNFSLLVWWLFHHLKLFANNNYSIFLIYDNKKLIHRSFIFPKYFRFPFMTKNDLQIGDTYTDPNYRGKNLATFAIQEIVKNYGKIDGNTRNIWYLVDQNNTASIHVIEKAEFKLYGKGQKNRRFGMSVFGYYDIEHYENNN